MIDKQGRLFNRVSIVDIVIVLAVLALVVGFVYRRAAPRFEDILRPDETFYVTFEVNRIRSSLITDNTIVIGEPVFRQHDRQPLGTIIAYERHPATEIIRRADGTAVLAEMEGRYSLRIIIEAVGSITGAGYLVGGSNYMAPGADIALINSRFIFPLARVHSVDRRDDNE